MQRRIYPQHHLAGHVGRQLPRLLREAGLRAVQIHAVGDVDRAPLDPRRFLALFDPASPACLLADPDFFQIRTFSLAVDTAP
ncbi:MAG TPA: hypothetical protein VFL91_16820 [Thermomicrobiales bacterium]|nr:hypothetical protein [Thermomicrobiales bacterium]